MWDGISDADQLQYISADSHSCHFSLGVRIFGGLAGGATIVVGECHGDGFTYTVCRLCCSLPIRSRVNVVRCIIVGGSVRTGLCGEMSGLEEDEQKYKIEIKRGRKRK